MSGSAGVGTVVVVTASVGGGEISVAAVGDEVADELIGDWAVDDEFELQAMSATDKTAMTGRDLTLPR